MARIEKADRALADRLDEAEQRMFLLKIEYEKYFTGIERKEPLRERLEIQRMIREFTDEPIRSATQRFRHSTLKARFQSLELYWTRNLLMMERGTHPKLKFRADLKEKVKIGPTPEETATAEQQEVLRERQEQLAREDRAYRMVFEKFVEARKQCGQDGEISYDAVRDALRNQVRTIKATYNVDSVKFRVVVENGKAKVKAVPQQAR